MAELYWWGVAKALQKQKKGGVQERAVRVQGGLVGLRHWAGGCSRLPPPARALVKVPGDRRDCRVGGGP